MFNRRQFLVAGTALTMLPGCVQQGRFERRLILPWTHSAEFSLAYEANQSTFVQNGSFEFVETRGSQDVAARLQDGEAHFALIAADVLMLSRAAGIPIKAIASVYQQSPAVIVSKSRSGITSPRDLIGRRVGVIRQSTVYQQYLSMLRAAAVDPQAIEEVPAVRGGAAQLKDDEIDALTQFSNFAPVTLRAQGEDVSEFFLHDYGIDMYGTCLVATDAAINEAGPVCQELVHGFRAGYQSVSANPEHALALIPPTDMAAPVSPEEPLMQLRRTIELIQRGLSGLDFGHMSDDRWRQSQDTLVATGQLSQSIDVRYYFDDRFLS